MDWSWLGGIFRGLLHVFDPLKAIAHWKIWAEIWKAYLKFKKWRDWYRDHVGKQIRAFQKLQRQIYDTFFVPFLKIIDTIRRISQVVGLFNRRLADRLNVMFLRVESWLLQPMNAMIKNINAQASVLQAILTPLGYFDRATLLNTLWRDIGKLRELLRNPLGGSVKDPGNVQRVATAQQVSNVTDYLKGASSPVQSAVEDALTALQRDLTAS